MGPESLALWLPCPNTHKFTLQPLLFLMEYLPRWTYSKKSGVLSYNSHSECPQWYLIQQMSAREGSRGRKRRSSSSLCGLKSWWFSPSSKWRRCVCVCWYWKENKSGIWRIFSRRRQARIKAHSAFRVCKFNLNPAEKTSCHRVIVIWRVVVFYSVRKKFRRLPCTLA